MVNAVTGRIGMVICALVWGASVVAIVHAVGWVGVPMIASLEVVTHYLTR